MWPIRALAITLLLRGCGSAHHPHVPHHSPGHAGLPPSKSGGAQVIGDGRNASWLSAFGGYLVFSRRDDRTSRYALMSWHDGRLRALPVRPREVPFDADVGPDANGRPVVVYSACVKDDGVHSDDPPWSESTACRIMELPLDRPGSPRVLATPRGSATTPSEWRGRLAYASHVDDQSAVRLEIEFRGTTAQELPLPKTCAACQAWIESLDLGPRAAAFVWRNAGSGVGTDGEWILQVDPLDGSRAHRLVDGYDSGACGYVRPLLPTVAGAGAFWTAAGSSCDHTATDFAEADPRSGRRAIASDPRHLILGATRDGNTIYWLRGDDVPDESPVDMTTCEARGTDCLIVRASRLHWHTRKPGQALGPHPHG